MRSSIIARARIVAAAPAQRAEACLHGVRTGHRTQWTNQKNFRIAALNFFPAFLNFRGGRAVASIDVTRAAPALLANLKSSTCSIRRKAFHEGFKVRVSYKRAPPRLHGREVASFQSFVDGCAAKARCLHGVWDRYCDRCLHLSSPHGFERDCSDTAG